MLYTARDGSFAGVEVRPIDERKLQRKAKPLQPTFAEESGERQVRRGHINICGENGEEEDDESPSGGATSEWE